MSESGGGYGVRIRMDHNKYQQSSSGGASEDPCIWSSSVDGNRIPMGKKLLHWSFDWKYMVRGLVLDKKRGNILKMDRHKDVKIACHGFTE
ncbi:hypothetical protein AKJ16_DCAP17534 [Drosera capensis]